MSNKMTCLGCDSYTSAIYQAYSDGQPCPYCGLPAEVTAKVLEAQKRGADEDLIRRFQEAEVRAGKAEADASRLARRLDRVKELLNQDLKSEDPVW